MASTYTAAGIELIGDGEQSNTWGQTTNENWELMEEMVAGGVSITLTGSTYSLATVDGNTSNGRHQVIIFTGTPGATCTVTVSPNDMQKTYAIVNNSDQTVTMAQGSGTTVDIAASAAKYIYCDGAGASASVTDISSSFTTLTTLGVTASASELNLLDGATSLAAPVPSGAVFYFAASSAPTGYLECDGSAVSRTTYSALYAVVGDTFGSGDGSTTFNLPDLRGEFIRGYDNGRGKDASRVFGAQQDDAVTEHNHNMSATSDQTPAFPDLGNSAFHGGHSITNRMAYGDTSGGKFIGSSTASTRGNFGVDGIADFTSGASTTSETETRPTNVALLPCIKT